MTQKRKPEPPPVFDYLKWQRKIREDLSREVDGDLEKAARIWRQGAADLLREMENRPEDRPTGG